MYESATVTDWAQLATWVDGEGSICIIAARGGKRKYHTLRINVVNSDFRVMTWLQERFAGVVSTARHSGVNHKPIFHWAASQTGIEELLLGMLPFMVIKAEEVRIALKFRTLVKHSNKGTRAGKDRKVIPQLVIDQREACRLELIATRRARDEARMIIQ